MSIKQVNDTLTLVKTILVLFDKIYTNINSSNIEYRNELKEKLNQYNELCDDFNKRTISFKFNAMNECLTTITKINNILLNQINLDKKIEDRYWKLLSINENKIKEHMIEVKDLIKEEEQKINEFKKQVKIEKRKNDVEKAAISIAVGAGAYAGRTYAAGLLLTAAEGTALAGAATIALPATAIVALSYGIYKLFK